MKCVEDLLASQLTPHEGAQIFVWHAGRTLLDGAIGFAAPGRAMQRDFIYRQHCALKPVTALALAALADEGKVSLDAAVEPYLPDYPGLVGRGIRIVDLLDHSAGLHGADLRVSGYPASTRRGVLRNVAPPAGWRVGRDQGYSDVAAWNALEEILERLTGEPLDHTLRTRVLDPLGLSEIWFGMRRPEQDALAPRLHYSWDLRFEKPQPLLGECSAYWLGQTHLGVGGYAPTREMGRMYVSLLEVLSGTRRSGISPHRLAEMIRSRRGPTPDAALQRECAFGQGFMCDLRTHVFGDACSPRTFGHSGFFAGSFGFADPDAELAVAVLWNGLVPQDQMQRGRRACLVSRIYAELGV